MDLSDVYLQHVGPTGRVITVGAGVGPGLEVNRLHVLLQTLGQGKLLSTLTDMRQLLLVDNLDMTPESRGLVKLSTTLLTHDDDHLEMYRLVVLDHVALLVEGLLTLGTGVCLRPLMDGSDVGGSTARGCELLITIRTLKRLLSRVDDSVSVQILARHKTHPTLRANVIFWTK